MSTQITTAFVEQFGANVSMLAQQKSSRLRNTVRVETGVVGEAAYFEQIGSTSVQKKTSRHSDTPQIDTPHAKRQVTMDDYQWADLIDNQDKIRTLIDPENPYVRAGAAAMGRQMDSVIITAFDAVAYTGKGGTTSTAYDTNNTIAVTVGNGGSGDVGLNVKKLIRAKEILDAAEHDPDEMRYIIVNARQLAKMLDETEVKSSDYNTVKALVKGELNSFMGFEFIRTELVGTDANGDHKIPFYTSSAMLLAIGQDEKTNIDVRTDKSYSTQVYKEMTFGSTRMEESGVGLILCDPTALT